MEIVDSTRDALYNYNDAQHKEWLKEAPWKKDPHHFKSIRISAVALLKMVMHARSGGSIEVMGLMQGYTSGSTFVITDAFRLPVDGTETRVNAQEEANEYLIDYLVKSREAGQLENPVGWYHSHPGYGCWLSGIDVSTQVTHQTFEDPFVAVVIDPDRTISAGKVEIGAFRTFPEGYKASGTGDEGMESETDAEGFQTIPLGKAEDFGAYSDRYYSLEVSSFKSSLDTKLLESLWNKYWVSTLAASPLFTNHEYGTRQIADLAVRTKQCADSHANATRGGGPQAPRSARIGGHHDAQVAKIVAAGKKIAAEEQAGLTAAKLKEKLFGGLGETLKEAESVAME